MELLFIILALLVVTRIFAELAERMGQPALVGELLSGVCLGLLVAHVDSGWLHADWTNLTDDPAFNALTYLGMFFLMLLAGIEMEPLELAGASRRAFLVAVGGMVLPFGLGFALGWAVLPDSGYRLAQAMFLGTAMSITAVPVTVRILMDLRQLHSEVGRTVVSAALFDDLLSLLLLAMLTAVISTGRVPTAGALLLLFGKAGLFFGLTISCGWWLFPKAGPLLRTLRIPEAHFSGLLIAALAYAVLAELLHLHFIVGAFTAGVFFQRKVVDHAVYERVEQQLSALTSGFLAPIFFASIGLHLTLTALVEVPLFVVTLIVVALISKFVGAAFSAHWSGLSLRESSMVGVAMSGRGAVELVIATVALEAGLFDHPQPPGSLVGALYSAIVIMALVTTVLTPVLLKALVKGAAARQVAPGPLVPARLWLASRRRSATRAND